MKSRNQPAAKRRSLRRGAEVLVRTVVEVLQGWLSVQKDGGLWTCCKALEGQSRNRTKRWCVAASTDALVLRQSSTPALQKKTISGWSCSKAFEGAKAQSGNGTKRLRLTASRARLGAEMERALGPARVAAHRKKQGRFLELLQGL